MNAASTPLTLAGGTIVGGSIRAGSKVQVVVATPLPSGLSDIQTLGIFTTFAAAGGQMDNVANSGTVTDTAATLMLSNVTNSGTVSGNTGAVIEFQSIWANTGTIKIDGTSSLYLGSSVSSDPNFPPTLADGSAYAWNPAAAGSIQVADGATVGLGGLLTTDQFMAFANLPNVSIHPVHDTVLLDGWLDNNPADNPVTRGVLALTSATGPLNLAGGLISGGTITSTGTGALDVIDSGAPLYLYVSLLDNVTNDGAINVSQFDILDLDGTVVNNGTMTCNSSSVAFLPGTFINNGTLTASNYSFIYSVVPGDSITNNGSIVLTDATANFGYSVINNGTITLTGTDFYVYPGSVPGSLTNTGSI